MIEVPWNRLDPEVLAAVVEEYVSREGTDYGHVDVSLAQKVAEVIAQLQSGKAMIVFDEATESTGIVPTR